MGGCCPPAAHWYDWLALICLPHTCRHAAGLAIALAVWQPPPAASAVQRQSLCWQAAAAAAVVEALLRSLAVKGMLDRLDTSLVYRLAASCSVVFGGHATATLHDMARHAEQQLQPAAQKEAVDGLAGLLAVVLSAAAAAVTIVAPAMDAGKGVGLALQRTILKPQAQLAFLELVVEVLQFTLRVDPGAATCGFLQGGRGSAKHVL